MTPFDPLVEISDSYSFKLNVGDHQSLDFWFHSKSQCRESEREEKAVELYEFCKAQVVFQVGQYNPTIARWLRDGVPADVRLEPPPPKQKQPQENPFRVGAAPAETAPAAVQPGQVTEVSNGDQKVTEPQVTTPKTETRVDKSGQGETSESVQPGQTPGGENSSKPAEVDKTKESVGGGETPPQAARRGRPPKTQPPAEPAAEKGNKQEPLIPKNGFQADDSDIPASMGGTSDVPPAPDVKGKSEQAIKAMPTQVPAADPRPGPQLVPKQERGQMERIKAVVAHLAESSKRDPVKVDESVKNFMRAFLNFKGVLPKPPNDIYIPVLPILESLAYGKHAGDILGDAHTSGLKAGAGWGQLARHVDRWRADIKQSAIRTAIQKYPYNAHDLLDFLQDVAKLGDLNDELLVFLDTFYHHNAAVAMALRESGVQQNKPMKEILNGLDVSTCGEGAILSRMSGSSAQPSAVATKETPGQLWED
jgi:hypothetical protein